MPEPLSRWRRRAGVGEVAPPRLRGHEFRLLCDLIREECGMHLSEAKMALVQNRLGRRLRALDLDSFGAYHDFLRTPAGRARELSRLFSAITTNETHFFREPHHFELLTRTLLPELDAAGVGPPPFRVWSAGCSTGQEPYTLAMVLREALGARELQVLATDIDEEVLATAEAARYPALLQRELPARHLLHAVALELDWMVIKPELRRHVSFRCLNLKSATALRPRQHVIFCRNVIMYLHMETRARLARVFYDSLLPGGFLVLGSSESLHGVPPLFTTRRCGKSTVYQKAAAQEDSHDGL